MDLAAPGPTIRGLFAVLVAVPALALVLTRLLDLPRLAAIGVVLMAISPGAPVALRRTLDAGGHRAFASSLQICYDFASSVRDAAAPATPSNSSRTLTAETRRPK
ncbi:MAG: hypothetical protein ACRDQ2_16585 [Gaiellales bacterium]